MTINTSGLGGGGLPRLAADLLYPQNRAILGSQTYEITNIDASGGLTTALSLTGKYVINYISFKNVLLESMTIKLTVDGLVVWNSTFTAAAGTQSFIGGNSSTSIPEAISCNTSFLLEVQMATDTSIDLEFLARPIQ